MEINTAEFVVSNSNPAKCPPPNKPEYAFIGRSNVGKSSLINMITGRKGLSKTSSTPGKTQLINHFLINRNWFLVDLPGYGYAKVPKKLREAFTPMIKDYISARTNLMNLFVLIDSRLPLQKSDEEFITWLGQNGIPFSLIYTKCDKLSNTNLDKNLAEIRRELKKNWENLPLEFITSAEKGIGKNEILKFIEEVNAQFVY